MNKFFYIVLALGVSTVVVHIVYHFASTRNPLISKFERSFWHFVFGTAFYALLVLVSFLHLSSVALITSIPFEDQPTELVVQELVKSQQRMKMEIDEFREVLSFVLLITGLYVISVLHILQQFRNERKRLSQDAVKVRPLGLELD